MCREAFDWLQMAADLEPEISKYERLIEKLKSEEHGLGIEATKRRLCYEEVLMERKSNRKFFLRRARERSKL